jgi:hypothetical protein
LVFTLGVFLSEPDEGILDPAKGLSVNIYPLGIALSSREIWRCIKKKRRWVCPGCGARRDRDGHAAKNENMKEDA